MQNAMRAETLPQDERLTDEELADTMIAISVVAKQLAEKFRTAREEGDRPHGPHE